MSYQDTIVACFFDLSRSDQETVFRTCLTLLGPHYHQQMFDLMTKPLPFGIMRQPRSVDRVTSETAEHCTSTEPAPAAHSATPGCQPLPAPAGTAAAVASDGGAAAALGKNTDFASRDDAEALAKAEFQSDASSRTPSVQRVACSRVLLLTVPGVAQKLGISVAALRREIRCGRFPRPLKIGGRNRFSPAQVEAFLAQFGTAERIACYKRTGTERERRRRLNNEMVRLHCELLVERKGRRHA